MDNLVYTRSASRITSLGHLSTGKGHPKLGIIESCQATLEIGSIIESCQAALEIGSIIESCQAALEIGSIIESCQVLLEIV